MTEFRTRIRSVRMKNGGAQVHVLHTEQPNEIDGMAENWRGKMIHHAKGIASYEGDLAGFVVIGLWADGARSVGYRMAPHIPRELFPSYIAEMLRSDAITDKNASDVFDDRFYWSDGT